MVGACLRAINGKRGRGGGAPCGPRMNRGALCGRQVCAGDGKNAGLGPKPARERPRRRRAGCRRRG